MRLRTFLAALPLLALPVAVGTVEPAAALSCVGPDAVLKSAESIIAGRITDYRDHRIRVSVDEIWRGERVAEEIWLRVELEGWWPGIGRNGKLPEGWSPAGQWVFAPKDGAVNPCTAWRPDTFNDQTITAFRPEEPAGPLKPSEPIPPGSPVVATEPETVSRTALGTAAAGGAAVGLLGGLAFTWLRRRPTHPTG
jgi:hypothetical protein